MIRGLYCRTCILLGGTECWRTSFFWERACLFVLILYLSSIVCIVIGAFFFLPSFPLPLTHLYLGSIKKRVNLNYAWI